MKSVFQLEPMSRPRTMKENPLTHPEEFRPTGLMSAVGRVINPLNNSTRFGPERIHLNFRLFTIYIYNPQEADRLFTALFLF